MENTEANLVVNLIDLQGKIQKKIGIELSAHGIGLSEFLVLNQLSISKKQKLRRSDLAEQVGLSPSGVTRLLLPMEKIGLVVREENPRDARVSLVALSEAGKRIFEESLISFEQASMNFFKSLSSDQLAALSDLIRTV